MTTTPNFRALCAELVDQLSAYDGCDDVEEVSQHWNYTNCNELLHRASTALATPPPEPVREGPSIDDILHLCVDNELLMFVDSGDFDTVVVAILEIVCAALARWGRTATPPPEPPTSQITFNAPLPPEEVIRLDKEGFHYKGQFVADAGEAHRLMMAFLEQNTKTKPEPPTDEAESKPVAWMYRGEPSFDGTEWREIWKVTTDKRLAEYKAKPDQPISLFSVLYRTALATPLPEPPKNCWLDDEPDLLPSPCVFDDPDEVINNCTYARTVKCKTDCKYYRVAAHTEPVQAPPPEPPTDQEIQEWADAKLGVEQGDPQEFGWGWRCFKGEAFAVTIRAALERWGK